MSKYTIELNVLCQDPTFNPFNFEYDFYTDDLAIRKNFEKKFIDHYFFHEIGQETVARFMHTLKARLNMIAPLYTQIYETELKSKDIEFLLNKDYTETLIRDNTNSNTNTQVVSGNNITNTTQTTNDNFKESSANNGLSDVNLSDKSLTTMNNSKGDNKVNSTSDNTNNVTSNGSNEGHENYTLTGKGNIGTTSSASLLKDWREVLINIDQMIIDELYDLFMLVY